MPITAREQQPSMLRLSGAREGIRRFAPKIGQTVPAFGIAALPAFAFFFCSLFASLAILASFFLAFSFLRLIESI